MEGGEVITEKGVKLNKAYFKSLPGKLKIVQIILGIIYTGIMIEALSGRWFEFMYRIFITCGSIFAVCSMSLLFACLLEYGPDGILIMARICFIYHKLAAIGLFLISMTTLIPLIIEIIKEDGYYDLYMVTWWIKVSLAATMGILNSGLYVWSSKLVQRSIAFY